MAERRRASGFTLLEVLVAVAVFGVMATLAYAGLAQVIDFRGALEARSARFAAVQKTLHLLQRDLVYASQRGIRDSQGTPGSAMIGGYGTPELALTRTRDDADGPGLMRVEYALVDGQLERRVWGVLDRMPQHQPLAAVVLPEVTALQLRFMDAQQWRPAWPPGGNAGDVTLLPRAVEVRLSLAEGSTYRRVFAVTGSG